MENTVKRPVGQFRMMYDSLIWLDSNSTNPPGIGVGHLKSGTQGAFIDNPPERFLDEHDVLLLRDKNGDGFLDGEDAKASLQEIKDFLFYTENKRSLSAEELIDLGYVALTRRHYRNSNVFFVNQPHDGTLSWEITDGKKQTLVSLMNANRYPDQYHNIVAKIKESDSAKTE